MAKQTILTLAILGAITTLARAADPTPLPALPPTAQLTLDESWSTPTIDPTRWYAPRRQWGQGNHGVTPDNLTIRPDTVFGKTKNVLVCTAHGDQYTGPVLGLNANKTRVGSMIVSKTFFASGRFEVVMKIGDTQPHPGGPQDPRRPVGTVPAIWTYAWRAVRPPRRAPRNDFHPDRPLYNPFIGGAYWSEIDFPEFGKAGRFDKPLYNTFLQNKHEPKEFDVPQAADGQYHTFTTDWRTHLVPVKNVTDTQVTQSEGYYWIHDKRIPYDHYYGNPLKRLAKDQYAVYAGLRADHYIDGKKVAENTTYVPSMAAQLTLGIWLPDWAGPAPWQTSTVSFATIKVWQFHDEGDVRNILTQDCPDKFTQDGKPLR